MPCKISKSNQNWATRGKSNEIKSKLACVLEASGSTRLRVGESLPNHHEDHIVGKETIHCSITTCYTNLFLCPKPWGQNCVDKEVPENVVNGKLTGSVLKETIAVSDTIRISVQNRHSRTVLQDPLRSRV